MEIRGFTTSPALCRPVVASPQVKSKPYRLSRDKLIWAQDKINEMLTRGIIRPSESKYASPCVIVPKADGSFRLCQDYRAINKFTDLDPFPFPCIDDVISNLGGCKVFSKIDLKDGFHQMPLSEKSKRFTAFVLPFGHYEFNRLPFGWKNSPSKFQRIMVTVLGDLLDDPCIWVYIDDIVVGGRTLEDLKFLGRTIDGNTKTTNQESVEKVKQMRRPSDLHSLRVFTGLTGHFRAFIKDYAKIVRPLDQLKSKGQEFIWSDEAEAAFQALKTAISSNPVLQLPDWKLEFELCTDASNYGCGAILYQRDPSKSKGQQLRVIGYYSHTFTKAECNFSVTDKEGLAVINAIKYFRTYLEGRRFTVHTDHQALSYILGIKEPKGRLGRWQVMLMGFDVLINHRSGKELEDADAISRLCIDHSAAIKSVERVNERISIRPENVPEILKAYHDDPDSGGHDGFLRTYMKLKSRFQWPKMKESILQYVRSCHVCQLTKFRFRPKPDTMVIPIRAKTPFEHIHIDFGELSKKKVGQKMTKSFLIAIDENSRHMNRFVPGLQIFVLPSRIGG
ncbi:unnamed protein product [Nesidiocoris tenuis]|uniref:RNA-directed DNA polymerase n=1 Tax=Nesidiocoris tenuis TaxID=355587 RepID=A0A6H5GL07_9HEMI|nr:unnamed protein product [Nesidiocoris tenuis]